MLTLNYKAGLDRSPWRPEALAPTVMAAGYNVAYDMRNNNTRNPFAWRLSGVLTIDQYSPLTNDWIAQFYAPEVSGVAAGTAMVFHPSQGPGVGISTGGGSIGTIAAGATTTSITISSASALQNTLPANGLADRGDGVGYRMRVIGLSSGGSGKTEEVTITGNTNSAQPTITFTPALSFTPQTGDGFELLTGQLYTLGSGAIGATTWYRLDLVYQSPYPLVQTNLAATIGTDSSMIATSELYVSNDRNPGDGFIDTGSVYNQSTSMACSVSAVSSTTLTCSALANPSTPSLFANEYRNFQVRIVYDSVNPTAVGQRRNITSHTSGNTPVFTVPAFTVTPSTSCLFVVEQNNDRILLRTSTSTNIYNYSIGGGAWDASTTWTAGGGAPAAACMLIPAFGITRDPLGARQQGDIIAVRGGANSEFDLFQPQGGTTGLWTSNMNRGLPNFTFTTGNCGCYDPVTNGGKYFHISAPVASAACRMLRLNVATMQIEPGTYLPYPGGATLAVGQRMFMGYAFDGPTKVGVLYQLPPTLAQMFSQVVPF